MANLVLHNIHKNYENGFSAVHRFSLRINDGEFLILVGPSGCGKSTLLRMIAGLESISSGELWIDGQLSNFLEPQKRNLSMVFQNYALYPNMTVYENMAFGLKANGVSKKEIEKRIQKAGALLQIESLMKRKPSSLSGGQKQRVAIGSTLVRSPKICLMDEPLSNLDAKLRAEMRVELSRIHQQLHSTILYVTHDQTEAMTLGSRIAVLDQGLLQQVGTPQEIYSNPVNQFVAGFIGSPSMNFLDAELLKEGPYHLLVFPDQQCLRLDRYYSEKLFKLGYTGKHVIVGIRPEDFILQETVDQTNEKASVSMHFELSEFLGTDTLLHGTLSQYPVIAKVPRCRTFWHGEEVFLFINLEHICLFDPISKKNILYKGDPDQNETCQ